ncbi:MAG: hypothetical protein ACI8WT_003556, partial [Clostridium sp.]
ARAKYGVHNGSMAELREGEAEIIDEYNRMK